MIEEPQIVNCNKNYFFWIHLLVEFNKIIILLTYFKANYLLTDENLLFFLMHFIIATIYFIERWQNFGTGSLQTYLATVWMRVR